MESVGGKLRTARNEKGLSFEEISRETNISIRYLEALENENFSVFPGEPYIIGFLKNYGSYLDLDVDKLVARYKALLIQEQPVPVEQLLKPRPKAPKFLLIVIAVIAALCLLAWGIFTLISFYRNRPAQNVPAARTPVEYAMEGNFMEKRFYKNDSFIITVGDKLYKLELDNIGEAATILTPSGSVVLDLSQEAVLDLDNNGFYELRITVADFAKNNPDMGVLLHFFVAESDAALDGTMQSAAVSSTPEPAGQNIPPAASVSNSVRTTIIPASPSAFPVTLQADFQGYCMFRWEVLNERDRAGRNQRYFQRGDELNVQAQNGIRVWASNAQAARFQVIGGGRTFPVEIGAAGEVVVSDIRWVRDENNQFRLVLIRLETGN